MSRKDPSGLVEGWSDPSSAPDAFPEGDEGLWSAWKYDIPSDPAKVASCICHYRASSNGNAALAESQADLARGERGPNRLCYDLSQRDTEHHYYAYANPSPGFVIPLYSVAKGFRLDYPPKVQDLHGLRSIGECMELGTDCSALHPTIPVQDNVIKRNPTGKCFSTFPRHRFWTNWPPSALFEVSLGHCIFAGLIRRSRFDSVNDWLAKVFWIFNPRIACYSLYLRHL